MPPPALLNQSWPKLKRSPPAFAVKSADHAVTVFVCIHLGDRFVCLVVDCDHPACAVHCGFVLDARRLYCRRPLVPHFFMRPLHCQFWIILFVPVC